MMHYLAKLLPEFVSPLAWIMLLLLAALAARSQPVTRGLIAGALVLAWLAGNTLLSMAVVRSLESRYAPPTTLPRLDAVVVLGGGVLPALAPRPMAEVGPAGDRVLYAARLYHAGVAPVLILSGARVSPEGTRFPDEATAMQEIFTMLGVPPTALILEREATNTYENARACRMIITERRFQRIGLVTSAQHMPRAVAVFRAQGIEVVPLPTDYTVSDAQWRDRWRADPAVWVFNLVPRLSSMAELGAALDEYLAIAVYRLRGWL